MTNTSNNIPEGKKSRRNPIRTIKPKSTTQDMERIKKLARKKSQRDPIRTIKPKSTTQDMEKIRRSAIKKQSNYSENLEDLLDKKLVENRDMKNWDQTPGRIMPSKSIKSTSNNINCRRENDEWVVSIKGKMFRISTDDADTREEAITIAKRNSKVKESKGWTHDSLAEQLFEKDISYEDQLKHMLNRKLKNQ